MVSLSAPAHKKPRVARALLEAITRGTSLRAVESRLVSGQAKAVWYRYAVETIIQTDPILDELYDRYQYEERSEFVESAMKEKVKRVKQEADKGHENSVNG
jgi:hypothetical protein